MRLSILRHTDKGTVMKKFIGWYDLDKIKKTGNLLPVLCGKGDSNSHTLSGATTSK